MLPPGQPGTLLRAGHGLGTQACLEFAEPGAADHRGPPGVAADEAGQVIRGNPEGQAGRGIRGQRVTVLLRAFCFTPHME